MIDNSTLSFIYLSLLKDTDTQIFNKIQDFDEQKLCFGDANLAKECKPYLNFAVIDGKNQQLAGYLGFCQADDDFIDDWLLTIIIAKPYRQQGLGDYLIKQALNTIFDYWCVRQLHVTIEENNQKSIRLFDRNKFKLIVNDLGDEWIKINGKLHPLLHYLYTKEMYQENKVELRPYQKLLIKQ